MTTGEKIKAHRLDRGLTQKSLAELCGMIEPTIRKYESGRANPKLETLKKIANALEVSVNDLLAESIIVSTPLSQRFTDLLRSLTHRRGIPEMEMLINNHDVQTHLAGLLEALYLLGEDRYTLTKLVDYIIKKKLTSDELDTLEHIVDGFCSLDSAGKDELLGYIPYLMFKKDGDTNAKT